MSTVIAPVCFTKDNEPKINGECCGNGLLKQIQCKDLPKDHGWWFCLECGRHWHLGRHMQSAASNDKSLMPEAWPWERPFDKRHKK
jgi:hypothetical protein